jgi:RimJ/RimL family protein N-acetyltransferase
VAVPIIDPPRSRPAGSLELFAEDLGLLREFRCYRGRGSWFEREAKRVLRTAIGRFRDGLLQEKDRILLFERDGDLQAVSVLTGESSVTGHLAFVGTDAGLHGARIDSVTGDRLSDAVVETTLEYAVDLGFHRVTAQVAQAHEKSLALLDRTGFRFVSRFDRDYDLYAMDAR